MAEILWRDRIEARRSDGRIEDRSRPVAEPQRRAG
jgi:hypothetical protein